MASLVVQTSFLGDVILTTPLIAELASRGAVDVLTTSAGSAVLANNAAIRNTLVFDKKSGGRLGKTWNLARSLRDSAGRGEYDTAYMAQGSLRSASIAAFAGIPRRVGFRTSTGRAFYTETVEYRSDRHHAERLLRLAGVDYSPVAGAVRPKLFPGDAERAFVDHFLAGIAHPFVVFAPGSAWGTKRWPFFPELARLVDKDLSIVVIGGASDARVAGEIEIAAPGLTRDATGELSVLGSAELIRRAVAIVTNDSAPLHLASAMNTPTVAVFGPTVPQFGFGPLSDDHRIAGHQGLDCRPCDRHGPQQCPLGHWRCMRELSPGHVYDLLENLISPPGMA